MFQSGYLSARLTNYALPENSKTLIINISKGIDAYHHLLEKEDGFRAYFKNNQKKNEIIKIDIKQTDYDSIATRISETLALNPDIKAFFVTNSRVFSVAQYLEKSGIKDILLVGYDFLENSIEYLEKDIIAFLICQKPQEQAYKGIMSLYQKLVLNTEVENTYYMPIDIITKENYKFYRN